MNNSPSWSGSQPAAAPIPETPQAATSGEPLDEGDTAIPVLTEVVRVAADAMTSPIPGPAEDDLQAGLERRIVADVLDRMLATPELLGDPFHEALRAAIDRFAAELALELRARMEQTLVQALEPAVRAAVREAVDASMPRRIGPG